MEISRGSRRLSSGGTGGGPGLAVARESGLGSKSDGLTHSGVSENRFLVSSGSLWLVLPVQPRRRSLAGVSKLPRFAASLAPPLAVWTVGAINHPVVSAIDKVGQPL